MWYNTMDIQMEYVKKEAILGIEPNVNLKKKKNVKISIFISTFRQYLVHNYCMHTL